MCFNAWDIDFYLLVLTNLSLLRTVHFQNFRNVGKIHHSSSRLKFLDPIKSIGPFKSGKCGKGGGKLLKFEYLENEKSIFDEI